MLDFKEAKERILNKNRSKRILGAYEFEDIFAFTLINNSDSDDVMIGGGCQVINKATGEIYGASSATIALMPDGKLVPKELYG